MNVIIDTDISIDVDDVGSICLAHGLMDAGELNILAIVHNTGLSSGIGAVSVLNHFYGRNDIPLGAYRGTIGRPSNATEGPPDSPSWTNHGRGIYVDELVRSFESPVQNMWQVPTALRVYIDTLEAAEDNSVVIVNIGLATNVLDLVREHAELVRRKVAAYIVMGGRRSGGYEWNFAADGWGQWRGIYAGLADTTRQAFELFPSEVPKFILPYESGHDVMTGGVLTQARDQSDRGYDSPCRRAYFLYCGVKGSRSSWDPMVILFAARGNADSRQTDGLPFYDVEPGFEEFHTNGEAFWEPAQNGSVAPGNLYTLVGTKSVYDTAGVIDGLLQAAPRSVPSPPPSIPLPPSTPCESWCSDHSAAWENKCNFRYCFACGECEPPAPASPPPLPPADPPLPFKPPQPPQSPPQSPPLSLPSPPPTPVPQLLAARQQQQQQQTLTSPLYSSPSRSPPTPPRLAHLPLAAAGEHAEVGYSLVLGFVALVAGVIALARLTLRRVLFVADILPNVAKSNRPARTAGQIQKAPRRSKLRKQHKRLPMDTEEDADALAADNQDAEALAADNQDSVDLDDIDDDGDLGRRGGLTMSV